MGCGLFLFRLVGVCSSSSELVSCFSRWCFGQWIMWVIFEMIFLKLDLSTVLSKAIVKLEQLEMAFN
jgi:hypothetical protein